MIIGADSNGMPEANPFWDYSLAVYGREPVRDCCLALQESDGADVNLVLYAAWCGAQGVALDAGQLDQLEQLVAPWRDVVVIPLRTLRREAKAASTAVAEAISRAELAAERHEQDLLFTRGEQGNVAGAPCVGTNLELLRDWYGGSDPAWRRLAAGIEGLLASAGRG
jgi:uncharacterized protein (TIGR02444 family)